MIPEMYFTSNSQQHQPKIQNQLQWLNWKCDELHRKIADLEKNLHGRDTSLNLLRNELQNLQHISQTLEQTLCFMQLLKQLSS